MIIFVATEHQTKLYYTDSLERVSYACSWMLYLKYSVMSKVYNLLAACKANLGNWTCAFCASNSSQPAATFREIKKKGYKFETVRPGRWARTLYCSDCKTKRTHYKLLFSEPQFEEKERIRIGNERERILKILKARDAFTGASITSTPQIDHKVPWIRLDHDIDASILPDNEIKKHFQILTEEHNLLKDRMCRQCTLKGVRPPLFGINFWYAGDRNYQGTCEGCGWFDGVKWKEELNKQFFSK